ncbi:MAG TPA: NAD(P)H-dependent oxidoreductase subunit E, partial [bacterium]|nr:NAD(P)H-dependent oxidoreductase subunit E [bacterium]
MECACAHILVCTGSGCIASGALEVKAALERAIEEHGLGSECKVIETGCLGPCAVGPVMVTHPDGVFYQEVKAEDAEEIVKEHLLKGRIVDRLVHKEPARGESVPAIQEIGFFKRQVKIVLRNCGVIDPTSIEEYIARDGYQALSKAL